MEWLLDSQKSDRSPLRSRQVPQTTTLRTLGRTQIEGLCSALDIPDQVDRTLTAFDLMSSTWGDGPIARPRFKSDITDDSSPYEFSVAFDGRTPDLRVLAEAQGSRGTSFEQW